MALGRPRPLLTAPRWVVQRAPWLVEARPEVPSRPGHGQPRRRV